MYKIDDLFNKISEKDLNGYLAIVYDILCNKNCEITVRKVIDNIEKVAGKHFDVWQFGVDIDYKTTDNDIHTKKVPLTQIHYSETREAIFWDFLILFYGGLELYRVENVTVKKIDRRVNTDYVDSYYGQSVAEALIKIYGELYVLIPANNKKVKNEDIHGIEYHVVRNFSKTIRERLCMNRMIDFSKDYKDILNDVIDGKLEFEYAFGIDRCPIKNSKDLYMIITSDSFNSSKSVPMSGEIRADRSMSQLILYHYQLLDDNSVWYIYNLFHEGTFKGKRPFEFFVKKLQKKIKEDNITKLSSSVKLLLEMYNYI